MMFHSADSHAYTGGCLCDALHRIDRFGVCCGRRYVINPPQDEQPPVPKRGMVELLRKVGVSEVLIRAGHAKNVLGPDSAAIIAQRLRSALVMRPRRPNFGEVPGITPDAQVGVHMLLPDAVLHMVMYIIACRCAA